MYEHHCKTITFTRHTHPHQYRVTYKEDRSIVSHEVPVSLLSVKLDSKASRVTHRVGTPRLTTCIKGGIEEGTLYL